MNHIHLIGRLGADPHITPYNQDQSRRIGRPPRRVVSFDLAVERVGHDPKTGEVSTDWIPVTAFDGVAGRFAADHLSKGDRVAVSGRLEATNWAGSDGPTRKIIRVVAREIIGLDYHRGTPTDDADRPIVQALATTETPAEQDAVR